MISRSRACARSLSLSRARSLCGCVVLSFDVCVCVCVVVWLCVCVCVCEITHTHTASWRRFMLHAVMDSWHLCVLALQEAGCDACGVNLNGKSQRSTRLESFEGPRFGGNFWWARCSWVRTLNEPYSLFKSPDSAAWKDEGTMGEDGGPRRERAGDGGSGEVGMGELSVEEARTARKALSELWLGSGDQFRPKELWNSHVDHYSHEYPPSAYLGALRYSVARKQCEAV